MAKKKSKAQQKEERRRAMARKRRETGWQPPPAPDPEQEQLMADMAPLLMGVEDDAVVTEAVMVPFMQMVMDSDDLIQEPEFDGIYADPLLCMQAFAAGFEELGLEDVEPDELPAAERDEAYLELVEEMTMQVLAPELQEAILSALQDLRQRAREEGDEELMSQAATVYAFLDGVAVDEVWTQVGLVQAVTHRSLRAGLEMSRVAEEAARRAEGRGIRGLLGRLGGATPGRTMEDVLVRYPGLEDFLAGQIETRWQQGVAALASGALDLGLFSEAEISAALDKARSLGLKLTVEGDLLVAGTGSEEEKVQGFASWLSGYVEELATPRRLARMQARLNELADTAPPSELAFLGLLNEQFEEADGPARLRPVLERALVGEMQVVVRGQVGADG